MLNLNPTKEQITSDTSTYCVKCHHCGKFISRKAIEDKKAKFHFIPDNQFGPEESYWEHVNC